MRFGAKKYDAGMNAVCAPAAPWPSCPVVRQVETAPADFQPVDTVDPISDETRRANLARDVYELFAAGRVDLLPVLPSGVVDGADARSNILDTSAGKAARRSSYGNAPGGSVPLSITMLEGMLDLASRYSFRITTIAGGSHSRRSRHYLGVGFDIDTLDGRRLDRNHPTYRAFMREARRLGATEVLGPGDRGHNTHIHVAWPRNASAVPESTSGCSPTGSDCPPAC